MTPSPMRDVDVRRSSHKAAGDPNTPTLAAFSPTSSSSASPSAQARSTVLVQKKSPLLVATPPAVTRALAFSHPFLLPLTRAVDLLTWSSGDPWESFLVLAGFWAITLYGDLVIRYASPIIVVLGLIMSIYLRKYSPLSTSGRTARSDDGSTTYETERGMRHQKSLDEIVETLNTFTTRCDILLSPLTEFIDFLSTQQTATSATTRPALTSLLVRILFVSPIWAALSLPPLYLINTRRVVITVGTIILTWHSRPARVTRTLLWRSRIIRQCVSALTGLSFRIGPLPGHLSSDSTKQLSPRTKNQHDIAGSLVSSAKSSAAGVRFTFVVYENQRRWLGLGWTYSLLAYERAAWTDEHLNTSDAKDDFNLPAVEHGTAEWHWVPGSEWQVDHGGKGRASGNDGWIYYDNKWNDGRRGHDGWGRYTRRRKWYRDAELVETGPESGSTSLEDSTSTLRRSAHDGVTTSSRPGKESADDASSTGAKAKRRSLFRRRSSGSRSVNSSSDFSGATTLRNDEDDMHVVSPEHERDGDWEVGDDIKMGLG